MTVQRFPPSVFITGDNTRLVSSMAICLILRGSKVIVHGNDNRKIEESIYKIIHTYYPYHDAKYIDEHLVMCCSMQEAAKADMSILLTAEDVTVKRTVIRELEKWIEADRLIVSNMESILLAEIQKDTINPERILGANWVEPIYTTCFLEVITSSLKNHEHGIEFSKMAKLWWGKDPYIVKAGFSVRSRLMCAILREGFFLIENEYAGREDIDRACRNDAGFYLAFAGNFRYMDLMGLYPYGVVMKDLNPELSRAVVPPDFFTQMLKSKEFGMNSGKGFFEYDEADKVKWENDYEKFSLKMEEIIRKYPFNYVPELITPNAE